MVDGLGVDVRDRVGYVTVDRQERRNALSEEMLRELAETFTELDLREDVWAVLLTGAGDAAFSAGRDLKDLASQDRAGGRHPSPMRRSHRNAFEVVYECRKPVVAAINGWAVGGGLELAMACDVRLAADHAKFSLPESLRGMGANFGAAILPRLVPIGVAYDLLYTGRTITAQEALSYGLVNTVVPAAELADVAEQYVRALVARAPLTVRRYKAVIQASLQMPLAGALRLDLGPDPYSSEDRVEGVRAFTEKREPRWQAR